jgi:hypothetical protein
VIDDARLESDEGGWLLVLDDDSGTHSFRVDPQMVDDALERWRLHMLEGEVIRREYEATGRVSWDAYKLAHSRFDPEWADELRAAVDHARKQAREGAMCDPGDHSQDAA